MSQWWFDTEEHREKTRMNRYQIVFDSHHHTFLVRRRVCVVFWKAIFRSEVYFCALAFLKEMARFRHAA